MDAPLTEQRPPLRLADFLPLVLLCLLALFFHRQLLFGGAVLMGDDVLLQNLPEAKLVHEAVGAGRLPLWNPYSFVGYPFYAEGQAGVFYPPTLFLHKLTRHAVRASWPLPPGPPWRLPMAVELFGHHLAFSLLVYLLARHLGSSAPASLFAAVSLAYGGFTVSHLVHQNIVRSLPYLPLLWLFSTRATANGDGGSPRDIAFHGVTLGLLFVAGHHQSALLIGLSWVVWVAFLERAGGSGPDGWVRRTLARTAWPTALGLLLAAVQLYPTFELWSLSIRTQAATAAERLAWSFTPVQWIYWLLPLLHGSEQTARPFFGAGLFHELVSYVGVLPLLTIVVARPWRGPDKIARFLIGFGLFGLLLAAGPVSPLYPLHWLPPLSLFRNPCRFLMWVELALALVGARALDRLISAEAIPAEHAFLARYRADRVLLLGLLFVGLSAAGYVLLGRDFALPRPGSGPYATQVARDRRQEFSLANLRIDARARQRRALRNAAEGGAIVMAMVLFARLLLGLKAAGRISPATCAAWLVLAGAADVAGGFALRAWDTRDLRLVLAEPGPIEFLRTRAPMDRYLLEAFPKSRPLQDYVKWRSHAANLYSGISSVAGYMGPLTPRSWVEFFRPAGAPPPENHDVALDTIARMEPIRDQWKLSVAGAAWVLSTRPVPSTSYIPRMSEDDVTIYRNMRSLPRLYIARPLRELKPGEDRDRTLAGLFAKVPCVTVQRTGQPDLIAAVVVSPRDSVSLTESHPEEVYALTNLAAPAWLIIADQAYPGWKVFVSDHEVPVHTACGLFRAVLLPAGVSDVRISFQPEVFRRGAWITLFALGLTIVLLGASLFAREPRDEVR